MGKNKTRFILLLLLSSCASIEKDMTEQYKNEILETESAFAKMAVSEGVPAAFLAYAAEDAVLNRGKLIYGKDSIKAWFENWNYPDAKLEWDPEFIDVSECGDLGYTYGYYTFSAKDTSGETIQNSGIFHTVWKKQPDGQWKFVWD
jgi:ketosteroid isomerase-like protein